MTQKKIIVIHGRGTKPKKEIKEALIKKTILNSLKRLKHKGVLKKIKSEEVKVDVVYYGDITNAINWAIKNKRKDIDNLDRWPFSYEPDKKYQASLQKLFKRKATQQEKNDYFKLRREKPDLGYVDEIADIVSPFFEKLNLHWPIISPFVPELKYYLEVQSVRRQIIDRLHQVLIPALERREKICLIAHSMGSMIAYEALLYYSRQRKNKKLKNKKIDRFMTLGCPLGKELFQKKIFKKNNYLLKPNTINRWQNYYAEDDFVSHVEQLSPFFKNKKSREKVTDHHIYTFYVGKENMLNPHKIYGYLDNYLFASHLGEWVMDNKK